MEGEIQGFDWQEIVDRAPKGYLELNNGERVLHGPVESTEITQEDSVVIKLKWVAQMQLKNGVPDGDWNVAPDENKTVTFPNLVVPFEIEDTPEKGQRVRFGLNLLYFDKVESLDPKQVKGLKLDSNGLRPFHEVIVDVIRETLTAKRSPLMIEDLHVLALVLRQTKIPKNHQVIIDAWLEAEATPGSGIKGDYMGVVASLQKQMAEASSAEKS